MCSPGSLGVSPLGVESTLESLHPATMTCCSIINGRVVPQAIDILQEFPQRSVPMSDRRPSIYRLVGTEPEGTNVIAKRSGTGTERKEGLRNRSGEHAAPYPHAGRGSARVWLFLEDAGDELYSLDREDHRLVTIMPTRG
jgi:hypothetical protein